MLFLYMENILKETLYILFTHACGNRNGSNIETFRFETLDGSGILGKSS